VALPSQRRKDSRRPDHGRRSWLKLSRAFSGRTGKGFVAQVGELAGGDLTLSQRYRPRKAEGLAGHPPGCTPVMATL
jgi:hypothetical protein